MLRPANPGLKSGVSAPPRRASHRMKESNCRTVKQQEARSNCVAVRRGGEQPSARNIADNVSELDSAGQSGELADQWRSQAQQDCDPRRSHHTAKVCRGSLSGVWRSEVIPRDVRVRREVPCPSDPRTCWQEAQGSQSNGWPAARRTWEVRASVGARKRGNARGAKGRREVEA